MKKLWYLVVIHLLLAFASAPGYSQVPVNGLVAYYPFNGNAQDLSVNGNNGTVNGGVTLTSDRFGNANAAYNFDGSTGYISVPYSSSLQVTGDISVCAWLQTSTAQQDNKGIVERYYSGTQNDHGWLLNIATGGATIEGRDGRGGATTLRSNPTAALADNKWHFVVGQRSGNLWRVYLDGQLSNSVDVGGTAGSIESGGKMTIGAYSNTAPVNGVWKGAIDDIRIYNRALSQAEINSLFTEVVRVTDVGATTQGGIPANFRLSQNYPNPFNPSTRITFDIPGTGFVSLKVYDLLGREMASLVSQQLNAGHFSATWMANVPSGVYLYRLQAEGFTETKRMILIR